MSIKKPYGAKPFFYLPNFKKRKTVFYTDTFLYIWNVMQHTSRFCKKRGLIHPIEDSPNLCYKN